MIEKIGVLCQDRNSFGFLLGIQRRLQCEAELVEPATGSLARSTFMSKRQAKLATADLRHKGVDLIVRFTDADRNRWQNVKRSQEDVFPNEWASLLVCAVAVENVEQWLALDTPYIETALGISKVEAMDPGTLTATIKRAIARHRDPNKPVHEVAARIVADAPANVFRKWLNADASLNRFYQDCRAAANRAACDVPNELDA